jgi:hypothetical protein
MFYSRLDFFSNRVSRQNEKNAHGSEATLTESRIREERYLILYISTKLILKEPSSLREEKILCYYLIKCSLLAR